MNKEKSEKDARNHRITVHLNEEESRTVKQSAADCGLSAQEMPPETAVKRILGIVRHALYNVPYRLDSYSFQNPLDWTNTFSRILYFVHSDF